MDDEAKPSATRTCSRCGTSEDGPDGGLPEGWSVALERGRRIFQCAACVRSNISWIEGGISSEWWDP